MQPNPPQSPQWWLEQLYRRLRYQQEHFDLVNAYYCGEPKKMPWLPDQAQNDLRRLIHLTRSNYMGLVVDAMVERMQVEGFRVNDSESSDDKTWAIWQWNNMDSASDQVLLESAIGGKAYILVAPNPDRPERPLIYPEHPTQAVVAYVPGTARRQRAAALKVWRDEWTGLTYATLYLPDALYKFQSSRVVARAAVAWVEPTGRDTSVGAEPTWVPRVGEDFEQPNELGVVPMVEIPNNPRLLTGGVSEIEDVIPIQDRVNKTLADRMMAQDYGAFPQKWAVGFPSEDEDGNPQRVNVGKDRMVTSDIAETQFGQWAAAPLDPYSNAKREDVKDIASRTRTPAQYLLGEMSNVNGETLKAAESGLISKVRQRFRTSGEGLEEVARLARQAAGLGGEDESMETMWRNPEFRTEGELVDGLVKMSTLNVPDEALWGRWGASPLEVERWKKMREDANAIDPIGQLTKLNGQLAGLNDEQLQPPLPPPPPPPPPLPEAFNANGPSGS